MANKTDEILGKLGQLKSRHLGEEDISRVTDWERDLRRKIVQSELMQRPEIQNIVADGEAKIEEINTLLMNDETLTDQDRKDLFHLKKLHSFYLERFKPNLTNERAEKISAQLDVLIQRADEISGVAKEPEMEQK